ncbi:MAG TPA: MotA/TolQ/ExbB proton channel family protein [Candidatus Merdimorpha stercoravium]|uniref:MotA/TolQ/ExbB proton channel family protein n=1 Tax=Candidatus Merdimorpha stercoravium TaxID=2840863 RepID=A0A9D1HAE6_9FLAO|nr:MotA/TolQ/ExbB proton channel family protein [Candidatus Merdimorpha stercoravium]
MISAFLFNAISTVADTLSSGAGADLLASDIPVVKTQTIWDMIVSGGWSGVAIIAMEFVMSVLAVYIFVERSSLIKTAAKADPRFMDTIKSLVSAGKLTEAKAICDRENTVESRIMKKGISKIGKPLEDISTAIENTGKLEIYTLEGNISRLAMIAGAAPMLGFLGTVVGMVVAFQSMANAGGQVEIQDLSGGISTAMTTTVAGLIVGIMAYIFYNLLVGRIQKVINRIEVSAADFLDLLSEPAE